jgi:hypothetical protein
VQTIYKNLQKSKNMENLLTEVLGNDTTSVYLKEYPGTGYGAFTCHVSAEKLEENTAHGKFYYAPALLSFGDYDNSSAIERANVREFLSKFSECCGSEFLHLKGAYYSESIYIDVMTQNTEIIEILQGLENYPAINDEAVGEVEMELNDQAWDCCYKDQFLKLLAERFGKYSIEAPTDKEGDLRQFFEEHAVIVNEYWVIESGGNSYIDVKRIVKSVEEIPEFLEVEEN